MFRRNAAVVAAIWAAGCGPTSSVNETTGEDSGCPELVWSSVEGEALELASVEAAASFPPYTRVEGRLIVRDAPGMVDLDFLACLEVVDGELGIIDLPDLETLAGLERLEVVRDDQANPNPGSDLTIVGNPKLADLTGLGGLFETGAIVVSGNPALTSLDGLSSLEIGGEIWIAENDSLHTIGLRALRTGFIHIGWVDCQGDATPVARGNAGLVQIDGLDSFVGYVGEVSGNSNLVSIEGLPDVPHSTAFQLNAVLSYEQIVALDDLRDAEFTTCGNLGDPNSCICGEGEAP